jgi:iduronate 2-sulfatase
MNTVRLFAALIFIALLSGCANRADDPRPNVLLIISDDLAARLACYGDPVVKSPNIDRLAARGVRFDRAYCQFPLCNPSRASFLTGLRPDTLRVYENATYFRKNVPDAQSLGQTFQKAGYYVARVGKLYHYGVPAQIGTDGLDDPPSWADRYNPKGADVEEQAPLIVRVAFDQKTKKAVTVANNKLPQFGATLSWLAAEGPDNGQTDGKIADRAIQLLERHKNRPFFLAVGFFRPHTPYVAPKKYFDWYPPDQIQLPTVPPQGYRATVPRPALTFRKEEEAMDDALRRQAVAAYHASTSFMDAQAGRVIDALDRLKLSDNTIIVFMSDHGYHLYEHQLWQKMTLFENSSRVPLIICDPRGGAKGAVSRRVVELVDLHATLAELCDVKAPKTDGVSIAPLVKDPEAAWDRPAITQIMRGGGPANPRRLFGYSVRTDRWRYTEWDGGKAGAELYDHDADPAEMRNLAKDSKFSQIVVEMKKLIPATRPSAT